MAFLVSHVGMWKKAVFPRSAFLALPALGATQEMTVGAGGWRGKRVGEERRMRK